MALPGDAEAPPRIVVLMPVRDDWTSAAELTRRMDRAIGAHHYSLDVVLVDDGSVQKWAPRDFESSFSAVRTVRVVRLRRNVGHQRAIAIGLVYVEQNMACDGVMVMDADGEDTPEGALQLLQKFAAMEGTIAVFAERTRRSESLLFRASYFLYRNVHLLLTGLKVRVGNFSILPASNLGTLVVLSELWNHYAAAVFHSRLPYTMVPIPRGHRIAGVSKMNFVALVTHGLSAISVYGDVVGVRILIASMMCAILVLGGIGATIYLRLFTDLSIPGWATYAIGTLLVILIQLIAIASSFTFFMLSNRTNLGFMPLRDSPLFIAEVVEAYPHG